MDIVIIEGLLLPVLGTTLGAACVFFLKKELNISTEKALSGFAAGVMIAASIWSLLIPSMNQAANMGKLAFIPAVVGFCVGMLFLLVLDRYTPHMHLDKTVEGPKRSYSKITMMVFAVILHNIPEGMATGVLYAGYLAGETSLSLNAALVLALGIGIQNFPEGAIISMPLNAEGKSKGKAFSIGLLSGIVEPIAAIVTILLKDIVVTILPYLLSFSAGAMIYVVIEELVPKMAEGEHNNIGTIAFMLGFSLMMVLDVALG